DGKLLRAGPPVPRIESAGPLGLHVGAQGRGGGVVKLLRDLHLHGDQQVTRGARPLGDAAATHPEGPAVGRARGNADADLAVEGGHRDGAAQRQLAEAHRDGDLEVVAHAGENLVRADVDGDEQVARGTAPQARLALTRQPDLLAVDDARRHAHRDGAAPRGDAGARTIRTGILDAGALPAAVRARRGEPEGPALLVDETAAVAGAARHRRRARLGAGPVAGGARRRVRQLQRDGHALGGLPEIEGDLGFDVRAAARPGGPAGARAAGEATEEIPEAAATGTVTENVRDVEVEAARATGTAGCPAGGRAGEAETAAAQRGPQLVVLGALVGVADDGVGLGDPLEAVLLLRVA